jgi:tRNA1(Val) A37 N6-methylase TrmN6
LSSRVTHSKLGQIHAASAEFWSRTPSHSRPALPLWIADVTLGFARHAIAGSVPRISDPSLELLWRILDQGAKANSSDMPRWFAYLEAALHMSERMLGVRVAKTKATGSALKIEPLRTRGQPCGAYATPQFIVDSVLEEVFSIVRTDNPVDMLDLSVEAGQFPVSVAARAPDKARINFYAVDRDPAALKLTRKLFNFVGGYVEPRTQLALTCRDSLLDPLPTRWPNQFDVVLGNPPWAGSRNAYNRQIKDTFAPHLSHNFDLYLAFLLRAAQYVKPGGTLAIVIPSTLLFNDSAQGTREFILDHFDIVSVRLFPRRSFIEVPCLIPISIVLSKKKEEEKGRGASRKTLISYHPHELGGVLRPRTSSVSLASKQWQKNAKKCFHPLVGAQYETYLAHFKAMPRLSDFGHVLGAAKLEHFKTVPLKREFRGFHARDIRGFHACGKESRTYQTNGTYFASAPQDSHLDARKVVFQNFRYMTHERRLVAATIGPGEYGVSTAAQFVPTEQSSTDFYTALLNSSAINSWFKLGDVSRAIKLAHVREIPVPLDDSLLVEISKVSVRCHVVCSILHEKLQKCTFVGRKTAAPRAYTNLLAELEQSMSKIDQLFFDTYKLSNAQRKMAAEVSQMRVF